MHFCTYVQTVVFNFQSSYLKNQAPYKPIIMVVIMIMPILQQLVFFLGKSVTGIYFVLSFLLKLSLGSMISYSLTNQQKISYGKLLFTPGAKLFYPILSTAEILASLYFCLNSVSTFGSITKLIARPMHTQAFC